MQALRELIKAQHSYRRGNLRRRERDIYHCEYCGFYHLTSHPEKRSKIILKIT